MGVSSGVFPKVNMVPLPEVGGKYLLVADDNSRNCFLLFCETLPIWAATIYTAKTLPLFYYIRRKNSSRALNQK